MLVLTAAVVAVGVLCLADLLLTFGVIRRLRQHSALLASRGDAPVATRLSIGESPGPFTAVTTDGVDLTSHAGFRIAAFFSYAFDARFHHGIARDCEGQLVDNDAA